MFSLPSKLQSVPWEARPKRQTMSDATGLTHADVTREFTFIPMEAVGLASESRGLRFEDAAHNAPQLKPSWNKTNWWGII